MNKYIIYSFFLIGVDRLIKALAINNIFEVSWFKLFLNQGIIFSLPLRNSNTLLLSGVIIVVLIYLLVNSVRDKKLNIVLNLTLVIIGASSNFFDRLIHGGVIDYLHLGRGLTINISDLYIICGIFGLILANFVSHNKKALRIDK